MSMPRNPIFNVAVPAHNMIPAAGGAVWYPLHDDSLAAGIPELPTLTETITGSAHADKWTTPGFYTFPLDNGATNDVELGCQDDDEDLHINSQLSLVGMAVGDHFITCLEASYTQAPGSSSCLWAHGKNNSTATLLGLQISSAEVPIFMTRAQGEGSASTPTLTASFGTFTAFKNQGTFALVMGIRPLSSTNVEVELRMSNGTLSAIYALASTDILGANTGLPGVQGGISMANFGGFSLGYRNGASAADNWWGRGSGGGGNLGRIGNFSARKFTTYSATRVADTLASMLVRPRDFPRTLCTDY